MENVLSAPDAGPSSASPDAPAGERGVLVIDDQDSVRWVTSMLLRRRGFRVVEARNGHEALITYRAAPAAFQLLLVDLIMPEMDGVEFLQALGREPVPPVIAMSGHDWLAAQTLLGTLRLAGYLQKPFTPEQLFTAITDATGATPPS